MNLMNLTRRHRPTTRRQRFASLAVEAMEERLTPSPTLPLPPPHSRERGGELQECSVNPEWTVHPDWSAHPERSAREPARGQHSDWAVRVNALGSPQGA
jgi:hypothetical protein